MESFPSFLQMQKKNKCKKMEEEKKKKGKQEVPNNRNSTILSLKNPFSFLQNCQIVKT